MTLHRLMVAAALFAAAVGLRLYLPETGAETVRAVQALVSEQRLAVPREAVGWMDWS